jgi:O-glycosyl hydrolase
MTFFHSAFYAYLDYDRQGGRFGAVSVSAATSDHQATSVYASVDEGNDSRVVIVALNKSTGAANVEITLRHPASLRRGRSYQVTSASAASVAGPAISTAGDNAFRTRLAPLSVTTLELTP